MYEVRASLGSSTQDWRTQCWSSPRCPAWMQWRRPGKPLFQLSITHPSWGCPWVPGRSLTEKLDFHIAFVFYPSPPTPNIPLKIPHSQKWQGKEGGRIQKVRRQLMRRLMRVTITQTSSQDKLECPPCPLIRRTWPYVADLMELSYFEFEFWGFMARLMLSYRVLDSGSSINTVHTWSASRIIGWGVHLSALSWLKFNIYYFNGLYHAHYEWYFFYSI